MRFSQKHAQSLALFCRVVDNYGDIGICWRLAQQFQQEHGIAVTLWVDDLQSFHRICPAVIVGLSQQWVADITIRHWQDQDGVFVAADVADIVIEFFACTLPYGYVTAMAQCVPPPVWLNLEGLSAEPWVEGCHTLPSPHPRLPLMKHFYFPGFTSRTGGLLHETSLARQCDAFQSDPLARTTFLAGLGMTVQEIASMKISLFCYPYAPVHALFDVWQNSDVALTCLVPQGVAVCAVQAFLGTPAQPGSSRTRGALTLRVIPFVTQPDYDRLLWACDFNFVRGEDSFVRAQWARKPFIWHIYAQDENLHHVKLNAFLHSYADGIDSLKWFSLIWNAAAPIAGDRCPAGHRNAPAALPVPPLPASWAALLSDVPRLTARAGDWEQQMLQNGDLASNLLAFSSELQIRARENMV